LEVVATRSATLAFLDGGGDAGRLMREFDWTGSSLGPPDGWPPTLKTAVALMLQSKQPVYIGWGPEQISLYNDGYIPICGAKHPAGFGQPAAELWAEIWDSLGPLNAAVMAGEPQFFEDMPFALDGRGRDEPSYFTFSYTPLRDEAAVIRGIYCSAIETTDKIVAERRLAGEAERWVRIFEQAPSFICTLKGSEHVFDFVNAAHRRLFGSADWIGKPVRDAFPDLAGQGFYEALDQVYATAERLVFEAHPVRYRQPETGETGIRYLDFIYAPLTEGDGRISGIFCEGYDVTDRIVSQGATARAEEQLRLAIEAAEVGLWDLDPQSDVLFWPPRVKAMFGISPERSISMADFYAGLHPDDLVRVSSAFAEALDPNLRALYDVEYRTVGKEDGVLRWVAAKGRALFDESGHCSRVIGTAIDITSRKDAEERLRLMVNELNHRVKNSLATVQAITAQTLRRADIPASVREALVDRLLALAKAHDVLTDENWSGASLHDMALQAAAPYEVDGAGSRFEIEGPSVNLAPKRAIAMAMAFHELATNAAKYGALSKPGGVVRIAWATHAAPDAARLRLSWIESGGPPVEPPRQTGFGTRLVQRGLASELNGTIEVHYWTSGVECTIDADLADESAGPGVRPKAFTG
jgi:PAS domain S-box-containing protein